MTKQEKVIVSAYTGIFMCDIADIKPYIEEKLGRPVEALEFGSQKFWTGVREKVNDDFMKICSGSDPDEIENQGGI